MVARIKVGLIAGVISLALTACLSSLFGLCGPVVSLIASALAGYFAAKQEAPTSKSEGGKPIIALPATTKNDTISRIVPTLKPGAGVVTSRGDVDYIVTEYGAVNLWGKTIQERAKALISIAHPNFRDELTKYAQETFKI